MIDYICMYTVKLVFTATTYLKQRNMDQPRKVAKPAPRGQLNREIKCPCRCIRGKYRYMYYFCLLLFIHQVYFLFGDMCIRARFTAVYADTFNMTTSYQ